MITIKFYRFFSALILIFCAINLNAQETEVMIRAKAKDAKFIGSSIGGAKIIIREALTGEILAQGLTTGSTGNTDKIMKQDWKRGEDLAEESTAGYKATLNLKEPVFVTIEAIAPVNKKQARAISSTQLWLIPGKHITGDGIVLEVPGFVIDILSPQTHNSFKESEEITISANIVMMCGCPVEKDGLWGANQYEVKAVLKDARGEQTMLTLDQKNTASYFEGKTSLAKGLYELMVYAYDPVSGNTGVEKTNIIIN
ncbi:hypothetical protein [Christiangramia aquimixticola]|uniref:hypothetical protein n=1 Tax=Christiangramia aquimixticola TaxID=1697558 RepID=UPI003AA87B62